MPSQLPANVVKLYCKVGTLAGMYYYVRANKQYNNTKIILKGTYVQFKECLGEFDKYKKWETGICDGITYAHGREMYLICRF